MPVLLDDNGTPLSPFDVPDVGPFGTPRGAKPEGYIATPDAINRPITREGGPPWSDAMGQPDYSRPSFGTTLGASFRLENEVAGAIRAATADRDFGEDDPDHNPWDRIKDDPRLTEHWQAFVTSRNAKETEYIASRVLQELEDRRIREAAGGMGFFTDMIAAVASPTILLPDGNIYRGYRAGYAWMRSGASVAAMSAAGAGVQEAMLQQQQFTRTLMEGLLNVGGATVLGGLLGAGVSSFSTRALARASAQIDAFNARVAGERNTLDAQRLQTLEERAAQGVITPAEAAERVDILSRMSDAPFGQPAGAAPTRVLNENVMESAFGLEKLFAMQGPSTRVMADVFKTARDVMTRLADIPGILKQNREGIPSGPAGGPVELRIKTNGDVAIYRMTEALHKNFAEYRFGDREASFAGTRASFQDTFKTKPGVMDWKTFKSEITRALREETDKGIEHPVPQVKKAAEAIRKEVFEPFKKEALKLGLFPKEAEMMWGYVMRRWDVNAIMNDYDRFKSILVEHLRGGQARAAADLARIEAEIDALRRSGDLTPEVESLARRVDAERQRLAVDQGTVDAVLDMWRLVVKENPKKPLSLVAWIKRNGGLRDEGNALAHMLGGRREAGRLIRKGGMALDDAGLRAFEKGYFPERPTISDLLDAIDDDIRTGGTRFSEVDAEAAETWRIAQEYREELERYGIAGVTSEARARQLITERLRQEANSTPAANAAREAMDADREFLADLAKLDEIDTPEGRAAVEDAKLDAETRIEDGEASIKRMGDDPETLLAAGVPVSFVRKIVESGRTYRFSEDTITANMEAALPYMDALPAGARMGTWASVGPSARGPEWVSVTFRTLTGDVGGDIPADLAFTSRAVYFPSLNTVIPNALGERLGTEGHVASGIYHEAVHAHLRNIDGDTLLALAAHAEVLRVMDMQLGTFLRIIGHPTWKNAPDVTLGYRYTQLYANDPPDIQARRLAEEGIAHMQELHYAGHFSDAEVAPVLDQLLAMRGGAASRMEGTTALDMPADAPRIDAAVGQSMQRSLDQLGFYSAALEAAARWGQPKGTLEQFTAWLKKSGVKDTELEATGFRDRFADRDTITRDEAVKFFEGERIALNERRATRDADDTEYHGYSLDPDNPTYRETVLYLPVEKHGDMGVQGHFPEPNVIGHMMTSLTQKGNAKVFTVDQIQSDWGQRIRDGGAMSEAEIQRTRAAYRNAEQEIQEAVRKVNAFLDPIDRLPDHNITPMDAAWLAGVLRDTTSNSAMSWRRLVPGSAARRQEALAAADELERIANEAARLHGEYRATFGAVPPHPFVSTTDQWLNTTLRRALRQAVEADAQYIAIPTGDTVLGYNPGDTHGMREFYGTRTADPQLIATLQAEYERAVQQWGKRSAGANGAYMDLARAKGRSDTQTGIVPKNLRNILQKIDKTIAPEFVETLDSPSGKKNLGQGFTVFPITEKVRQSVLTDGLPMFAIKGPDAEPPRIEIDPQIIETARALGQRLGVNLDLDALDVDGILAQLSKGVDNMMGRAAQTSKKSEADIKNLIDQKEELKWFANASKDDLEDAAREVIAKLTGSRVARGITPFDAIFKEGKSGPLQARTLKIEDAKVADFLDDDIERVALHYVRAMAPDVALAREFGDINLTEDLRRIEDEIQARIDAAETPAAKLLLRKNGNKRVQDIRDVVSRLRGTYNDGVDPMSWMQARIPHMLKQANILRLMGAVVASSIADPMKLLFTHGFRSNMDLFSTLLTEYKGLKLAKHEAKELGTGLEMVMSRSGQMWDAFDDLAHGQTMPERALRYLTNKMGRINLMDQWNSHLKQVSGAMTANRVMRAATDLANGRISQSDMTKLGASHISADIAREIAKQYAKHGTAHGRLWLANAEAWDDTPEALMAKQALASAVRREADITIVTPGQEKPLWTSRHWGSVVGQFRSFNIVSIQRTMIAGLQEADAAKVVALMGMIALGMLSEQLKIIIHGKEKKGAPKDMGEWLYAGLSNSGALGWLVDADQSLHKISGGNISVARRVFGNDRPISRYASQNVIGSLFGPSFGAGADVLRVGNAALSGKPVTEGDIHAMRRLMPYQNLFYISRSLRAFEEGLIDAWGIPRTQARN